MNRLILFVCFTVLFQKAAFSLCMPMRFDVWPEGEKINRNPLIIFHFSDIEYPTRFHGFGLMASKIGREISFYLQSGDSKILLKPIQYNRGQSSENQLILEPAYLLKPNTSYKLVYSCSDSTLKERLVDGLGFKTKTWVTNEIIDKQAPSWISKPQFWYKNYVQYGCGPESYWRFCMNFRDESVVLVHTIVRHLERGKVSEFYLHPDTNSVFVGYGMCGGEFDLIPGDHYSVSFHLIDGSGNCSNQFSDPVFVQAPLESEYISDEELEKKKCPCDPDQTTTGKSPSINLGWVLGIVGIIVLIALGNWYWNYRKGKI